MIMESQESLIKYITEREDWDLNWQEWNGEELRKSEDLLL